MESTHLVEPIASTVIDFGLKATLIVALAGLAIRLLTCRRPAWSCLLWSATLGAVALLPLGALLGPVLPWGQTPIPHFDGAWFLYTEPTPASLSPAAPITAGPAWWQWAVASLYLLGLAFALTRLGWGLWHLHRLRQSVHLVDAAPVEALRRQLGLHNPVQLGVSPLLQTPVLLGWRRPTIALPAALYAQCTPGALQDIIVHELVHLKRRDPLLNMLSQGVVALYWFHPLVHWAAHSLVEMRECACDDWVVAPKWRSANLCRDPAPRRGRSASPPSYDHGAFWARGQARRAPFGPVPSSSSPRAWDSGRRRGSDDTNPSWMYGRLGTWWGSVGPSSSAMGNHPAG